MQNRLPSVSAAVFARRMSIELRTPEVADLPAVNDALRDWQRDDVPLQFHPGDLGWFQRFGAERTARATRTWLRDGRIIAVGMADEPDLIRLTMAPDLAQDAELAGRLAADLGDPARGVLGEGEVFVEVPNDVLVRDVLHGNGWQLDEEWTPLRHPLTDLPEPSLRIEVIDADHAADSAAVQRGAFPTSTFTEQRWQSMAQSAAFADARSLVGYDDEGRPVASTTVWGAGAGRPGLIEPLGVHRDHRGKGYGRAICHAAGIALRELGASSMLVCTPSSNVGAVAAYVSAGFEKLPLRRDLGRKS